MLRRRLIAALLAMGFLTASARGANHVVKIIAHDLLGAPSAHPELRLSLRNETNKSLPGVIEVQMEGLQLETPIRQIQLPPRQTTSISFRILGGDARPSNLYPMRAIFYSNKHRYADHAETMRVNVIAHRTITVDGNLEDWTGVAPQAILSGYPPGKLPEETWVPYRWFRDDSPSGIAVAFLAYDADNFYFLAKIVDRTPDTGEGKDNVHLTFGGSSPAQMEFALNPAAQTDGARPQVVRLRPVRQAGGLVTGALLILRLEENSRLVEASLPWTELAEVKKLVDSGESVKFGIRINHSKGAALELGEGRSVSNGNLEFAFQK